MVSHCIEYDNRSYNLWTWNKDCCLYQQWVKYNTFYEIEILEKIRDLKIKNVYIDVGANVGNHTVYFSNVCMPKRIYAFEPSPIFYYCLAHNIRYCTHQQMITPMPFAVMDKPMDVNLFTGEQALENTWVKPADNGQCKAISLDSMGIGDVGLIKVDTETNELLVLKGAERMIQAEKPVIVCEANPKHKYDEINDYLKQFGYKDEFGDLLNGKAAPTYIWRC